MVSGNPFAPDSTAYQASQPNPPTGPFQPSAGLATYISGPAPSNQPAAAPKPEEYSFAELNPTGFASAPKRSSGTVSLPTSASPSPRLGYPSSGATAHATPPPPQQQYHSWPASNPASTAPLTASWEGALHGSVPRPWHSFSQAPQSPYPPQHAGGAPAPPSQTFQNGGGVGHGGVGSQWNPGFPPPSHGNPPGIQNGQPSWSVPSAQPQPPTGSARPQEVSGNALQRPFYPAGDGFRGGGGVPPPQNADSALWEFASLSSLKPKLELQKSGGAQPPGPSKEALRPMRPSGDHTPAPGPPSDPPAGWEQPWAATFPQQPPQQTSPPQQDSQGGQTPNEAAKKAETQPAQQSQPPLASQADPGPTAPSSAVVKEPDATARVEPVKKVPWALPPPKNDLPRPTSGGAGKREAAPWQPFAQGSGQAAPSAGAVATQLQGLDLLGSAGEQGPAPSATAQQAGPSSAMGRLRAESLRLRRPSAVAGRAPAPNPSPSIPSAGESEASQRARAFLAKQGLQSSGTADDEALAKKLQQEYDAEQTRSGAARRAGAGLQAASHADWWNAEPQQAWQPVPPSHIAEDEQLAQRLQQEEDARQRRPVSWPQAPSHGRPHPPSDPPLNLWQPPQPSPIQQPPWQDTSQPGYAPQGYGQQGYGGNTQGTPWWLGNQRGPSQVQAGYPQGPATLAPQPALTDDEAYARQLQEQFDRENGTGSSPPGQPHPAPPQAANPPPGTGGSWRRKFDRLVAPVPEDLCRGCKQPIGNMFTGGGQYMVAFGGKWHPQCLKCGHCKQPISDSSLAQKDDVPYHVHCHKELFHGRCCVCADFLPQEGTQIKWITDDFWKWRACPKHKGDRTTRCYACNRFQPNGEPWVQVSTEGARHLCFDCIGSIVVDTQDAQPLYSEILAFYEKMAMRLPTKPPLLLVEASALESAETREGRCDGHDPDAPVIHTRGLTLSMEYRNMPSVVRNRGGPLMSLLHPEPVHITGHHEVTAILVLAGMPRVFAGAILAHECMHAWLRLSGTGQLDSQVEEGLCQLMAVLWLGTLTPVQGSWEERLTSYCEHQIRTDRSLVYGEGFRAALEHFQGMGLPALVRHVQQTGRFPDSR